MTAARRLLTIAFCILSGAAHGQGVGVWVKAGTIDRYDWDTNEVRTRTPDIIYTNAVVQYPFSYADDSPYYDCSRSLNDGTQTTAGFRPLWTNGWGGAYVFATDDYIDIDAGVGLNPTNEITVSAWVLIIGKPAGAFPRIISKGDNTGAVGGSPDGAYGITYSYAPGFQFLYWHPITVGSGKREAMVAVSVIGDDAWHHIAGTFNGTDSILYVDGTQRDIDTIAATTLKVTAQDVLLGAMEESDKRHYDGMLDDVRIYDRALSGPELLAMYNSEPLTTADKPGKRTP